ncbi:MAG TPA: SPOR domain-containing protein [Candidatus Solibacter sp.]|nr:SPOR domain-containing protein [Candidatus Solibacter sp.]
MLEGRHVIGLFMLMLLFSGLFFTLGFVMGRDQYNGQVRAATNLRGFPDADVSPKPEVSVKPSKKKSAPEPQTATGSQGEPTWDIYRPGDSSKVDDHPKPANSPATTVAGKNARTAKEVNAAAKTTTGAPLNASGGVNLQVAALTKKADAMSLANTLRKKNFPTVVQSPHGDKYYHVLVGPYADQKAVENARKGLEVAGFKAIVKR